MNRRDLVADGFRYLARVLPAMVATAGSLGFLLHKPGGPVLDSQPGCFPAADCSDGSTNLNPLPKEG